MPKKWKGIGLAENKKAAKKVEVPAAPSPSAEELLLPSVTGRQ
jgi:hypothetical protein